VKQLDKVFSQLEQRHMSAEHPESAPAPASLPKPSQVYVGGMYWDWRPEHHPYIGGGYCSPRANKPITSGKYEDHNGCCDRMKFPKEHCDEISPSYNDMTFFFIRICPVLIAAWFHHR
jgi:hypothetical protein